MAPHPEREDAACTENPNQISSTQLHLEEGIWAPGFQTIKTLLPQQKLHTWLVVPQRFHPAHF